MLSSLSGIPWTSPRRPEWAPSCSREGRSVILRSSPPRMRMAWRWSSPACGISSTESRRSGRLPGCEDGAPPPAHRPAQAPRRGCAEDLGPGIAVVDLVVVTPVVAQGAPVRELRHFRVERQVSYGATLPEASRLGSDDDEGGRAPRPPQRHVAGLFVRMNE